MVVYGLGQSRIYRLMGPNSPRRWSTKYKQTWARLLYSKWLHVIRKVVEVIHGDLVKVLSWRYRVYPLIPVYYIILYNIGRWLKWRKYSIMMQRINHNYR